MEPMLMLDVDGVLAPIGVDEGDPDFDWFDAGHYGPLPKPKGINEALAQLAEVYELHWATSWEGLANEYVAEAFNLSELSYVHFPSWPKLPHVIGYCSPRPFAFVDDDLEFSDLLEHANDPNILLIPTNPYEGLTEDHLPMLLTFAKGHLDAYS